MSIRFVWIAGIIAGALVWAASPELEWPARAFLSLLLGPAPAACMFQAGMAKSLELPLPRLRIYAGSIAVLWLLGILAQVAGAKSDFTPRIMGWREIPASVFALWTMFAILACASIVTAFKAFGFRESLVMREIAPVTPGEKALFVLLAISAGIGEELTFRSFLIPALIVATGSLLAGIAVSSLAFGVMHAHQRAGGAARAAILGLILAFPLLVTGSVYPSIVAHASVDIIGGIWAARWLLK